MSFRNEKELELTAEQKAIKDKFSLWINGTDRREKLIDFIDQLGEIPDQASPIRILAQTNDALMTLFIDAAFERVRRDVLEATIKNQKKFIEKGSRSQFSLMSAIHFPNLFIKLITPIYRNAVYGCALVADSAKVDKMLQHYDKWLRHDFSKKAISLLNKIYQFAFEGYHESGNHKLIDVLWKKRKLMSEKNKSENSVTLYLVAKSLALIGNFDGVADLICKWCPFDNTEAHLDIIAAVTAGYTEANHAFELQRLQATQSIMIEINNAYPSRDEEKRKEMIFELINNEQNLELKKSLLIDCFYKGTVLGSEMWFKCSGLFVQTPSLKRGQLNVVLKKLIELGVDIAKLPGCSDYSVGWVEVTTKYPSKVNLFGLWPHSDPAIVAKSASSHVDEFEGDSESEESRREAERTLNVELLLERFRHEDTAEDDNAEKRNKTVGIDKKR